MQFTVSTSLADNVQIACNTGSGQSYYKNLKVDHNIDEMPVVTGSEFVGSSLLIYTSNMNIHNITTATFTARVVSSDGSVGSDIHLTNPSSYGGSNTEGLIFSYNFIEDLQYELEIEMMTADNYQYAIKRRLLFVNASVTSTKRFYTVTDQQPFDLLHKLSIEVEHEHANNVDYFYTYFFDDQEIGSDSKPSFKFKPSRESAGCHNISTRVTALNTLSATTKSTVCLAVGINITLNVELAQSLGKESVYSLKLFDAGPNNCFVVETGDGKYFVVYRTGERDDTLCSK